MLEVPCGHRDRPTAGADKYVSSAAGATGMNVPVGNATGEAQLSGDEPGSKVTVACVALDETPAPMPTELWESLVPHPQWGKWNDHNSSVILTETRVVEL